MSGGHFDYKQYCITQIADDIEQILNKAGQEKEPEDRWGDSDTHHRDFTEETKTLMKLTVQNLRVVEILVHRIDYLICGDDGEEDFKRRTINEISKLSGLPEEEVENLRKILQLP